MTNQKMGSWAHFRLSRPLSDSLLGGAVMPLPFHILLMRSRRFFLTAATDIALLGASLRHCFDCNEMASPNPVLRSLSGCRPIWRTPTGPHGLYERLYEGLPFVQVFHVLTNR
jgi:hypothetical protein